MFPFFSFRSGFKSWLKNYIVYVYDYIEMLGIHNLRLATGFAKWIGARNGIGRIRYSLENDWAIFHVKGFPLRIIRKKMATFFQIILKKLDLDQRSSWAAKILE